MIIRLLLATMFAAAGPVFATAEASCKFNESDVQFTKVPERFRADYVRELESRCEIGKLQPPLIEIGLAVLQDVKELETRAPARIEAWAEPLDRLHGRSPGPYGALRERVVRLQGMNHLAPSRDVQEVRDGNVARRLVQLAVSGRVTKQEYDSLVRRLQGN